MDNANSTQLLFDPYPPPQDLSIYPNATSAPGRRRQNITVVALGALPRPEGKPLAAAPAAQPPPPPDPPRSPPAPPAADPFKPCACHGWHAELLAGWQLLQASQTSRMSCPVLPQTAMCALPHITASHSSFSPLCPCSLVRLQRG